MGLHLLVDVAELRVAVGMLLALQRLGGSLQAEAVPAAAGPPWARTPGDPVGSIPRPDAAATLSSSATGTSGHRVRPAPPTPTAPSPDQCQPRWPDYDPRLDGGLVGLAEDLPRPRARRPRGARCTDSCGLRDRPHPAVTE